MLYSLSEEELRSACRTSIESLEMWARRLIHERMTEKYGSNYMYAKKPDGNNLVKAAIQNHVKEMRENHPERFQRDVDTLFIEDIVYFLCNPVFYKEVFSKALAYAYPQGIEEAREFLSRIIPIRNALSHSNPISLRQAEQVICYSHDFIEGIKQYNKERGKEEVWNIPKIIRITDSLGNEFDNINDESNTSWTVFHIQQQMYCGDTYSVEVEIDSSFQPSEYEIKWSSNGYEVVEYKNKTRFTITFTEKEVNTNYAIYCTIIQNKNWHKHAYYDHQIMLMFPVFPNE